MNTCPHGGGTNCRQCADYAYLTALQFSPATVLYMQELLAKLEPENTALKARIAELEAVMQDARLVIERQRDERLNLEAESQRLECTWITTVQEVS